MLYDSDANSTYVTTTSIMAENPQRSKLLIGDPLLSDRVLPDSDESLSAALLRRWYSSAVVHTPAVSLPISLDAGFSLGAEAMALPLATAVCIFGGQSNLPLYGWNSSNASVIAGDDSALLVPVYATDTVACSFNGRDWSGKPTHAPLPTPMFGQTSVVAYGRIYILGGERSDPVFQEQQTVFAAELALTGQLSPRGTKRLWRIGSWRHVLAFPPIGRRLWMTAAMMLSARPFYFHTGGHDEVNYDGAYTGNEVLALAGGNTMGPDLPWSQEQTAHDMWLVYDVENPSNWTRIQNTLPSIPDASAHRNSGLWLGDSAGNTVGLRYGKPPAIPFNNSGWAFGWLLAPQRAYGTSTGLVRDRFPFGALNSQLQGALSIGYPNVYLPTPPFTPRFWSPETSVVRIFDRTRGMAFLSFFGDNDEAGEVMISYPRLCNQCPEGTQHLGCELEPYNPVCAPLETCVEGRSFQAPWWGNHRSYDTAPTYNNSFCYPCSGLMDGLSLVPTLPDPDRCPMGLTLVSKCSVTADRVCTLGSGARTPPAPGSPEWQQMVSKQETEGSRIGITMGAGLGVAALVMLAAVVVAGRRMSAWLEHGRGSGGEKSTSIGGGSATDRANDGVAAAAAASRSTAGPFASIALVCAPAARAVATSLQWYLIICVAWFGSYLDTAATAGVPSWGRLNWETTCGALGSPSASRGVAEAGLTDAVDSLSSITTVLLLACCLQLWCGAYSVLKVVRRVARCSGGQGGVVAALRDNGPRLSALLFLTVLSGRMGVDWRLHWLLRQPSGATSGKATSNFSSDTSASAPSSSSSPPQSHSHYRSSSSKSFSSFDGVAVKGSDGGAANATSSNSQLTKRLDGQAPGAGIDIFVEGDLDAEVQRIARRAAALSCFLLDGVVTVCFLLIHGALHGLPTTCASMHSLSVLTSVSALVCGGCFIYGLVCFVGPEIWEGVAGVRSRVVAGEFGSASFPVSSDGHLGPTATAVASDDAVIVKNVAAGMAASRSIATTTRAAELSSTTVPTVTAAAQHTAASLQSGQPPAHPLSLRALRQQHQQQQQQHRQSHPTTTYNVQSSADVAAAAGSQQPRQASVSSPVAAGAGAGSSSSGWPSSFGTATSPTNAHLHSHGHHPQHASGASSSAARGRNGKHAGLLSAGTAAGNGSATPAAVQVEVGRGTTTTVLSPLFSLQQHQYRGQPLVASPRQPPLQQQHHLNAVRSVVSFSAQTESPASSYAVPVQRLPGPSSLARPNPNAASPDAGGGGSALHLVDGAGNIVYYHRSDATGACGRDYLHGYGVAGVVSGNADDVAGLRGDNNAEFVGGPCSKCDTTASSRSNDGEDENVFYCQHRDIQQAQRSPLPRGAAAAHSQSRRDVNAIATTASDHPGEGDTAPGGSSSSLFTIRTADLRLHDRHQLQQKQQQQHAAAPDVQMYSGREPSPSLSPPPSSSVARAPVPSTPSSLSLSVTAGAGQARGFHLPVVSIFPSSSVPVAVMPGQRQVLSSSSSLQQQQVPHSHYSHHNIHQQQLRQRRQGQHMGVDHHHHLDGRQQQQQDVDLHAHQYDNRYQHHRQQLHLQMRGVAHGRAPGAQFDGAYLQQGDGDVTTGDGGDVAYHFDDASASGRGRDSSPSAAVVIMPQPLPPARPRLPLQVPLNAHRMGTSTSAPAAANASANVASRADRIQMLRATLQHGLPPSFAATPHGPTAQSVFDAGHTTAPGIHHPYHSSHSAQTITGIGCDDDSVQATRGEMHPTSIILAAETHRAADAAVAAAAIDATRLWYPSASAPLGLASSPPLAPSHLPHGHGQQPPAPPLPPHPPVPMHQLHSRKRCIDYTPEDREEVSVASSLESQLAAALHDRDAELDGPDTPGTYA